jgi:hypothetical protein
MDTNPDTTSKIKRKHLVKGAVIGLLAGSVISVVTVILILWSGATRGGYFSLHFDGYQWSVVLVCSGPLGAMLGLLGGLLGGLMSPKIDGAKKSLVLSAILGGIGGLIAVIITICDAAAHPLTT